jgi:hypothetical protein
MPVYGKNVLQVLFDRVLVNFAYKMDAQCATVSTCSEKFLEIVYER